MLYHDFSAFTTDQEHLISINGLDYVEGSLIMHHSPPNNWRSSFFSPSDQMKINSLLTKHGIIYCLEVVKYYDDHTIDTVDEVPYYCIISCMILLKIIQILDYKFQGSTKNKKKRKKNEYVKHLGNKKFQSF